MIEYIAASVLSGAGRLPCPCLGFIMEELRKRKRVHLREYDYATPGGYFVTICTRNRRWLFGNAPPPVGRGPCAPPSVAGEIAAEWIGRISKKFPNWTVENWIVMPNHVHLLMQAHSCAAGHAGPALQTVVGWYKTMTTNACIRAVKSEKMPPFDGGVWQISFYDHVIRNEQEYLRVWQYIDDNPANWAEDEYYTAL